MAASSRRARGAYRGKVRRDRRDRRRGRAKRGWSRAGCRRHLRHGGAGGSHDRPSDLADGALSVSLVATSWQSRLRPQWRSVGSGTATRRRPHHDFSEPKPEEIEPGIWLLPAPLTHRHNLEDPTEQFDAMETPGARLRIGLAHGSIETSAPWAKPRIRSRPIVRAAQTSTISRSVVAGVLKVDDRTAGTRYPRGDCFERDEPGQVCSSTSRKVMNRGSPKSGPAASNGSSAPGR